MNFMTNTSALTVADFDIQLANWRMESIMNESDSSSNDEFFDAKGSVATYLLN